MFPFAKTGGLADVSGALPLALSKRGCEVKVVMPFYKNITPREVNEEFGVSKIGNTEFIFVRNDKYFFRDYLYTTPEGDYPDNLERFLFFCKKGLEILKKIEFSPDIIHCNDWQTSLVSVYLKTIFSWDSSGGGGYGSFFKNTKTVFTIHNLAYQGIFDKEKFPLLGLPSELFSINYLEFYDKINLLKGGIVFSDMVTTVSPTYAKQIQTPDYGCGLEGVLREKRENLCGILNAIDYKVWNPSKDKLIYRRYSSKNLEDKYFNKKRLQKELGLKQKKSAFLLGMVSRLAEQKGIDILSEALSFLAERYQIVILGVGEEKFHRILKQKAKKFKESFSLHLKFDESLAHKIYASCDCFLLPSKFEPCGLSQMISYKYATVPLVHHTGGLVDTVVDYEQGGGGFVFTRYDSKDLINTIERAEKVFKNKEAWRRLLNKIVRYNFSWDKAAENYVKVYERCRQSSA